jgi:hypothetical protein
MALGHLWVTKPFLWFFVDVIDVVVGGVVLFAVLLLLGSFYYCFLF